MRVKVNDEGRGEDIFDVEVQANGDWKFSWTDESGFNYHTYSKTQVHKFLIEHQVWTIIPDDLVGAKQDVVVAQELAPNYAAAFNMWMDEYVNSPQDFEDSYSTALNHVSEKLLGEEPSYGAVAAEQFKAYLEKVK